MSISTATTNAQTKTATTTHARSKTMKTKTAPAATSNVHATKKETTMTPSMRTQPPEPVVVASVPPISAIAATSPSQPAAANVTAGPNAVATPSADQIAAILAELDAIKASLGAGAVPLTIQARRQLLRIRPGGETHAATSVGIAVRYGLTIPGVDPDAVESDTELAKNLVALGARLDALRGVVGDMSLQAQARIWKSGTTAYTMLTRIVPQFPSLQRELQPMGAFLAIKHKDAPTSLRTREKKTNAQARATRKANEAATAGGATTAVPVNGGGAAAAPVAAAAPAGTRAGGAVAPGGTATS
jgi:hypothetical protein